MVYVDSDGYLSIDQTPTGKPMTDTDQAPERLKDLRQFIIGWREFDWPEGFDRFTALTIADEVEKRFPKNDAPDLAPAPLPDSCRDALAELVRLEGAVAQGPDNVGELRELQRQHKEAMAAARAALQGADND